MSVDFIRVRSYRGEFSEASKFTHKYLLYSQETSLLDLQRCLIPDYLLERGQVKILEE